MKELLYYFEIFEDQEKTEILNELLSSLGIDFCIKTEADKNISVFTFYAPTLEEAKNKLDTVLGAIKDWQPIGINMKSGKIQSLKKEDWTETWKKFFKIQHISKKTVIKASWLNYTPKPGEVVVEIDPGMSFGTGSHETTQYCLKILENYSGGKQLSLLDAGCGSGILSIAAYKLGYSPIFAFDYDEESVVASKENFKRNRINNNRINLCRADISEYSPDKSFDFVVANIISSVLHSNRDNLISWIKKGGCLVLAGTLKTEFDALKEHFMNSGQLIEVNHYTEKEWTGAVFKKN
ncbi:MAG: 50S ribosomal protein L11 methyltransferase [Victivallales bacterium]|nr:50S ribosomal protein L11 methyltransferase [Victivallales bacterium]